MSLQSIRKVIRGDLLSNDQTLFSKGESVLVDEESNASNVYVVQGRDKYQGSFATNVARVFTKAFFTKTSFIATCETFRSGLDLLCSSDILFLL